MKETIGELHDVVFHEAGHFFAVVASGILEGIMDNLFATGTTDQLEALHHVMGLAILDASIEILFVLADDDHIHLGMLGVDKRVIGNGWAYVGIETKHGARRDVETFVASALWRGDGSLKKHFGALE